MGTGSGGVNVALSPGNLVACSESKLATSKMGAARNELAGRDAGRMALAGTRRAAGETQRSAGETREAYILGKGARLASGSLDDYSSNFDRDSDDRLQSGL